MLGLTPSDLTQKLATYATDSSSFQFYASPLAKNLRLGRGYFVRLTKPAAVTMMGTPAPANQTFSMGLLPGWNLIGDPFLGTVQWSSVKVQAAGQQPVTVAQALQQGLMKAGLLTLGGNLDQDSAMLDPDRLLGTRDARRDPSDPAAGRDGNHGASAARVAAQRRQPAAALKHGWRSALRRPTIASASGSSSAGGTVRGSSRT